MDPGGEKSETSMPRPRPDAGTQATPASLTEPNQSQSLVRSLFSLQSKHNTEWVRLHNSRSFGELPFCGGEEEAHDHWHDKWEAHRRSSMDEVGYSVCVL